MKKLILELLVFSLLATLSIWFLSALLQEESDNDYFEGMAMKHERLKSIETPKIILTGGSNMAFGIDSKKIEEEFGIPTVNLAIHAGLGTSFILTELKESVSPGDVVLLSLEYFLDDGNYRVKKRASDQYPPAADYFDLNVSSMLNSQFTFYKSVNPKRIRSKLRRFVNFKPKRVIQAKDKIYLRDGFNSRGDLVSHLNKRNRRPLTGGARMKYRYWEGIEKINELAEHCAKMDVQVYYLFPTYAKSAFRRNKKAILALKVDILENVNLEVINDPYDFVFRDNLYYDTVNHLNKEGRQKRTGKLITILKKTPSIQERFASLSIPRKPL